MLRLKNLNLLCSKEELAALPEGKLLINTINAYSYNKARKDALFAEALTNGSALIPDGMSIVKSCRLIHAKCQPKERIAGWDLFAFEMDRLERLAVETSSPKTVMFMGCTEQVLAIIVKRAAEVYPHLSIATYSPPFRNEFSDAESKEMVDAINTANPDLLWIGMTAPKQEKWVYSHWDELKIHCHVGTIGAVFSFFAGTEERAPLWWQTHGLEWLYRFINNPKRTWKRYVLGNPLFLWNILVNE